MDNDKLQALLEENKSLEAQLYDVTQMLWDKERELYFAEVELKTAEANAYSAGKVVGSNEAQRKACLAELTAAETSNVNFCKAELMEAKKGLELTQLKVKFFANKLQLYGIRAAFLEPKS